MGERSRDNLFLIIISIMLILFLFIYFLMFNYYSRTKQGIIQSYMDTVQDDYEITVNTYSRSTNLIFDRMINHEEVLETFAMGVGADNPEEKDFYRKKLYSQLQRLYEILQLYNFRQLQFHEKNNVSFLRFHSPLKFGDDLTGYRATVEYVNYNREKILAFEGGRIVNGYRFVYPLSYQGEHVGSVEISVSIKAIIDHMQETTGQKIQFVLKKTGIEKKVFESELSNFSQWPVDSRYLLDNHILNPGFENKIPEGLRETIRNRIDRFGDTAKAFAFEGDFDGEPSVISFIPVTNLLNANVGYLICISDREQVSKARKPFILFTVIYMIFFALIIMLAVFYDGARRKMRRVLLTDHLTKLDNRHNLMEKVNDEFLRFIRYRGAFSVIIIDIDHFKKVNDTFGHLKGDDVLRELSRILKENIRKTDTVGRYGGEEFLVLLPETSLNQAAIVAENLRRRVEEASFIESWTVTISLGVAESDPGQETIEALIEIADKNLYKAKAAGRNRVQC